MLPLGAVQMLGVLCRWLNLPSHSSTIWVSPLAQPIRPVVLFSSPVVVPVTWTEIVQFPPAPTLPPVRLMTLLPASAVTVPPLQLPTTVGAAVTANPAGRLSVRATPART